MCKQRGRGRRGGEEGEMEVEREEKEEGVDEEKCRRQRDGRESESKKKAATYSNLAE